MATAYLALALCHFEWNNLDEAHVYLDQATVAHRADQEPTVAVGLQIARAKFHLAAGDVTAARAAITAARAPYSGRPLPALLHRLVAVGEADLDLATGHADRVWDRLTGLDAGADVWSTDRERVRLALAHLALGQPQQAAATVGPLLVDEPGNPGPAVEAWLVYGPRCRPPARGRPGAGRPVSSPCDLPHPEARRLPSIAEPGLHELLLRQATLIGTSQAFVEGILTDLVPRKAPRVQPAPLAGPLTDRETAVLRYLPTMLTNGELAETMYLSVNTVKAHLKSLYRKLGVTNRSQAVHRARELDLL